MAVSNSGAVLSPEQLNDLDRAILDYLKDEGRATPRVVQLALQDRGADPGVRQNVNGRLSRLAEHTHLRNVYDAGLYELVWDPRDVDIDEGKIETDGDGEELPFDDCPWCEEPVTSYANAEWHLRNCPN